MKRTKKALVQCLAIAFAAAVAVGASGCKWFEKSETKKEQEFINTLGGVSETYTGIVSTQSYASASDAAHAFVQDEVVGSQSAVIVNTTSNGTLSQTEVDALQLPESVQEGIVSIEKLQVEYTTNATSYTSYTAQQKNVVIVYVIKYPDSWKYYTPAPVIGETIPQSYYDSVFNYEKYENCTFTSTIHINANLLGVVNADLTMTQLVKHAAGKIYMERTMSLKVLGEEETDYVGLYMEETATGTNCYVKTSATESWISGSLQQVGFSSLEELSPFYDAYSDYTYFIKTDYGFRMSDESAKQYIQESLSEEESLKQYLPDFNDLNMNLFIKYYVSNGVLSGMRENAEFKTKIPFEGKTVTVNVEVNGESLCSNYGTTVVASPV